jgi:hypothetical protein
MSTPIRASLRRLVRCNKGEHLKNLFLSVNSSVKFCKQTRINKKTVITVTPENIYN